LCSCKQPATRHHNRNQHGLVSVELALILPFLLTVFFTCFEIGRTIVIRQAMQSAATVVARICALDPPNCQARVPRILAHINVEGMGCGKVDYNKDSILGKLPGTRLCRAEVDLTCQFEIGRLLSTDLSGKALMPYSGLQAKPQPGADPRAAQQLVCRP